MKPLVIMASIRYTPSFGKYAENFVKYGHSPTFMIVDETGKAFRKSIKKSLGDFETIFMGQKERKEWFEKRGFIDRVIPKKCTNENSIGLLYALEKDYDMIVFVDDDTYPLNIDFLTEHYQALYSKSMTVYSSFQKFVSPFPIYIRGFPSSLRRTGFRIFRTAQKISNPVLNYGLWQGVPDLNAMDYLYHGYTKGKEMMDLPMQESKVLDNDVYIPISIMNIAIKPEIIPAFYQLWHSDRYQDIFSGLYLQRINRHLNKHISYGPPYCFHDKYPRNVYPQIRQELQGIEINDILWKILDEMDLRGNTYLDCYDDLITQLYQKQSKFPYPNYFAVTAYRMREWIKLIRKMKE